MRESLIGFEPSRQFDLADKAERAEYLSEWKAALEANGFRLGEDYEKDSEGHITLQGLADMTDVFAHNVSIQLRLSIDALPKDSEAAAIVHDLWHTIVAQASYTHNIALFHAQKGSLT